MRYHSILEAIGKTPLVRINRSGFQGELYAKLEGFNPGGSIKDRVAAQMIQKALESGELRPGMTILEATSGNTGIGLALTGAVLGIKVHIVMSEGVSPERIRILRALDAEITFSPAEQQTDGAIVLAEQIFRQAPDRYYRPDQFSNPANPGVHRETTAREIWDELEGKVDFIIAGMGSTGTLMGFGEFFSSRVKNVHIVGVRPAVREIIDGIKTFETSLTPALYKEKRVHEIREVTRDDALRAARRLIREEGIFAGISGGAVYAAFLRNQRRFHGKQGVMIIADNSFRYMESGLFDPSCHRKEAAAFSL
jgi:cysteine synthase